jgi:lipoprotein-anchoring transpeptidase ErfK/SrfK
MSPVAPWRRGGLRGAAAARPLQAPAVVVAVSAALLLFATACGGGSPQSAATTQQASPRTTAETPVRPARESVGESIVASARTSRVAVYRSARSGKPFLRLSNPTSSGTPLVFLVRRQLGGRDQVYLPIRPNESTGWVNDRDVVLARNPYSLQVRLRAHQLVLRKQAQIVARIPAAVGRSVLPTPKGLYYIVELLKQPDPRGPYGPYAFGLSAHSNVLYSFGGGPGQIGIHGTDVASSIGRSASHGCIRIPNAAITRLAGQLPLGTPVRIGD